METISVVLAVFNEEENLEGCLSSIKDLADEIVVVDGGSKDRTVEIAKKFNAVIKITDNPQIFHINKQKAIDMATKNWVLQLDADERIDDSLKSEIKEAVRNKDVDGYWIPRKNFFLGRYLMKGGQYPDYTLRLYKNGKGRLPQKDVHEQTVVEGKVGYLKNPLIHNADSSLSRYLFRLGRYTNLIASQIKENEKFHNPLTFFKYLFILPIWWFLVTYIRHKGFMDGWQGFVFSLFSALRFPLSYIKYIRKSV